MLHCLLDSLPYRSAANFGEIALYALLGFLVVFLGITILIFVVWLVGKILNAKPTQKEKALQEPLPTVTESDGMDEETVAVITAALMAYYQTANPTCSFVVKRIKKL